MNGKVERLRPGGEIVFSDYPQKAVNIQEVWLVFLSILGYNV